MIPKWLYDALPYVITVIGVSAALLIYNRYAIISGILLIYAALLIVHLRLVARTRRVVFLEKALERERLKAERGY